VTVPASTLPDYDQLPLDAAGIRTAWGLFGPDESVGLMNLLTADVVRRGVGLAKRGAVFPLDLPLTFLDPPLFGRPAVRQDVQARGRWALNEVLHDFNPQSGSQWDALAHVSFEPDRFYNGASLDDILKDGRNTVEHWARRGIVGRGVLLDLERTALEAGDPYDPGASHAFSVADLERARDAAGVTFETGDLILLRTGFVRWYSGLDADERVRISAREELTACGIEHSEDMARFLWNTHASAVACDCPSLEVWPMDHRQEQWPFGCLHQILLGQFGLAIGELWALEDLADDCANDGVHEFMLASAPLHARSFGSTANALAIK
jgi:Putative cyclase